MLPQPTTTPPSPPPSAWVLPAQAVDSFSMPVHMGIHEFAATRIRFSRQFSPYSNYHPELAPYQAEVLDSFTDPAVREISLKWATQLGKSTIFKVCIQYKAIYEPGPTMLVLPIEKSRDDLVEQYKADFLLTPETAEQLPNGKLSITREGIAFRRMPLYLALADSEADLAQRSVECLIADEINKFPLKTTREGAPLDQAASRLRWYRGTGRDKSLFSSSCTDKMGAITQRFDLSDQRRWHVPCLRCGTAAPWTWENVLSDTRPGDIPHLEWGRRILANNSSVPVYYVCPTCKGRMEGELADQRAMNAAGRWIASALFSGHAGFHLPSMASPLPSCSWRNLLGNWHLALHEKEQGDDSKLATFIRHELAREYQTKHVHIVEANIVARQSSVPRGHVPEWVQFLSLGTDVQHDSCYYVLHGWNRAGRCHVVDHGHLSGSFDQVADLVATPWPRHGSPTGKLIDIALIDSGDGLVTMDVYKFCFSKGIKRYLPCKGSSAPLTSFFSWGVIRKEAVPRGQQPRQLVLVDTNRVKDLFAGCLDRPLDNPTAVSFHAEVDQDPEFQRQMVSEERQRKGKGTSWSPRKGYAANHYWDANTYATAGALVRNLFLHKSTSRPRYSSQTPTDPYGRKL